MIKRKNNRVNSHINVKNILMRAAMLPTDQWSAFQIIAEDKFGTNAGNMFFPYSVSRALMTDETVNIDAIATARRHFEEEEIERLNATYDCFVIPLANAFRKNFVPELQRLTKMIRKLDMPCIVVGVGLQAGVNDDGTKAFPFDKEVKAFVQAVLEKSSLIGVRGGVYS